VYPMLAVSLDYPYLITPSVFSNVYIKYRCENQIRFHCHMNSRKTIAILDEVCIIYMVSICCNVYYQVLRIRQPNRWCKGLELLFVSSSGWVNPKIINLVFAASPPHTQYVRVARLVYPIFQSL